MNTFLIIQCELINCGRKEEEEEVAKQIARVQSKPLMLRIFLRGFYEQDRAKKKLWEAKRFSVAQWENLCNAIWTMNI